MASSYPSEVEGDFMNMDNQEKEGSGQKQKGGENRCFELVKKKFGNKDVFHLKYGDTVQILPEEYRKHAEELVIAGDCLSTDEDVYQLKYVDGKIDIQPVGMTAESMPSEKLLKQGTGQSNIGGERFKKQDENKKKVPEAQNIPNIQENVTSERHGSQGKKFSSDAQKLRVGVEKSQGKDSPTLVQEQLQKHCIENDKKQGSTIDGENSQKPELISQLQSLPVDTKNQAVSKTVNPQNLSTVGKVHINTEPNKKPLFSQSGTGPVDDQQKDRSGINKYSRHAQATDPTRDSQCAESFNNTKRVQHDTQSEIEGTAQVRKQVSEAPFNNGPQSDEGTSNAEKETEPPPIPKKQVRVQEKGYTGLDSSSSKEEHPSPPERGSKRRNLPKTPMSDSNDGKMGCEGQTDRTDRSDPLAQKNEFEAVKSPKTLLAHGSQLSSANLDSSQNNNGNTRGTENQDGCNTTNAVRSDTMIDSNTPVGTEGDPSQEYELCITVKYLYRKEFNENASLTCNFNTYMKWNYALNNPDIFARCVDRLRQQSIDGIQTEFVQGERWLVIDLGTVQDRIKKSAISTLQNTVKEEVLNGTDELFINSFPPRGLNFAELSRCMMEKSANELNNELWVHSNDAEYVHYVCPESRINQVETAIKELIDLLMDTHAKIEYPMVFTKIYDHYEIKQKTKQKFRSRVVIAVDVIESENICRVTLNGPKSSVELAEKWLNEEYISKFSISEMSFNDMKNLEDHNVESLVKEVLLQLGQQGVFWVVNDSCKKICICSCTAQISDKVISSLKKCLKKKTVKFEMHDIILKMEGFKHARLIVKEFEERGELEIVGLQSDINSFSLNIDETKKRKAPQRQVEKDDSDKSDKTQRRGSGISDEASSSKITRNLTKEGCKTGLEQKIPFQVKDSTTFRTLCNSAELKIFSTDCDVTLDAMPGANRGFLLRGLHPKCMAVKDQLTQMISELKSIEQFKTQHWTLKNGHQVIVQSSKYLQSPVQHIVLVNEVPPEKANYDKKFRLNLPQPAEGKKKEKMEMCIDDLLVHCWDENLFQLKLEIPKLNIKTSKRFVHTLFVILQRQETERNPPFKLYLCVDSKDVYDELVINCDNSIKNVEASGDPKQELHKQVIEYGSTVLAKLDVYIIIGQINGIDAEAIVNTVGKDLNLASGNVSRSLLDSAGQELQEELWNKYQDPFEFGQIIVTDGYGLQGCKHVLHGSLDRYKGCKSIKDLRHFVLNCLIQADSLGCSTIAFPAIGTGNLEYPKPAVAHAMFNAVREYEGRQTSLKEVKFVIFHKDTDSRKEFMNQKKEHDKFYDGERLKRVTDYSSIPISVEYGSLVDIFSDCIIYIWEKKSSYTVKVRGHGLLKNVSEDVKWKWCKHRDNKNRREDLLVTSGGDLPVSKIIHVFSDDNSNSLGTALQNGLQATDNNTSVTLFFDKNSKFLRYGEQVVAAFFQYAKEILDKRTPLKGIHMVIESHVAKTYCDFFSKATERLSNKRQRLEPIRTFEQTLEEPRSQSMGREGEKADNTDIEKMVTQQDREWQADKDRYLTQPTFCDFYVLAKRKANDCAMINTAELLDHLPNGVVIIDSTNPQNEVVLKCKSGKEAKSLLSGSFMNQGSPLVIEKLPKQSLYNFILEMKEKIPRDEELCDKDISFDKVSNRLTLPTIHHFCQIENGQNIGDTNRERKDSEGFCNLTPCSEEVWEIIQISKAKYIETLRREGIIFSHENGYLSLSNFKSYLPDLDAIFGSIKMLQKMSILEVEVNKDRKKTSEEIEGWCNSIESDKGSQFIVFVKQRHSVVICCDTYENAQKIKHQILVKDGQVIPRARRRGHRNFIDSNDSVADVITKAVASPLEQQSDDRQPDVNEDTFSSGIKMDTKKRSKNLNFSLANQARNLERYTTDEGIKVLVYEANILKLPVDCIVNAANESLQHGGGVARVIAQAAGRDLDTEGFKYIRKYGKVPVGKACVTTAGKLHYDCVIHTVGPCWSDYDPHSISDVKQCERDLYSAIMESFLAAESIGLESIALPAISAAIFAVPVELCVYQYAKATMDYSHNRSPSVLKEIHFIDINAAIISSIQKMFKAFLRDKRNPHYSSEKFVKHRKSSFSDNSAKQRYTTRYSHKENNRSGDQEDGKNITITVEKDKCKLEVTCQDIMQVKADAIVSSEDLMGSGKGYIAKQILKKISVSQQSGFESIKKAFFGISTKPGDVYATNGYGSDYIHILHAVIPYETRHSSKKERKDTIKKAFKNVFHTLDDRYISSVVTGLLGAGSDSSEDIQIAAQSFVEAFNSYYEKRKKIRELKLLLVCKTPAVLSQIKQIFEDHGLLKKEVPPVRPPPPNIGRAHQDNQRTTSLETCAICMDGITDRKELICGHAFDRDCIDQAFKYKKVCPTCGAVCGEITGLQPEGTMRDRTEYLERCAGYESYGRIAITYDFPSGRQGPEHPNPNKWYKGIVRIAYLPDNADGREILEMLKIAFKRKLTFTIGYSRTTGQDGVITWNDIHHKTDPKPNTQFGYPDPTYLKRVKEELAAKGITPDQIPRQ